MADKLSVPRRPVILIILDGVGVNPSKANNAVAIANTPRLDHYLSRYPHTLLQASGRAVGLPDGQMGNSEVGHMTLGSGCVIRQDLVLIDDAIADRSFFESRALCAAASRAAERGRPVHLMGLVSDGGVHSHLNHLAALIKLCRRRGATPVVHMITDGRDTPRALGGELSRACGGGPPARRRSHRHRIWPLLCDGPRQPVGSYRDGLAGLRGGQGPGCRVSPGGDQAGLRGGRGR
jgi:hypothetical protein